MRCRSFLTPSTIRVYRQLRRHKGYYKPTVHGQKKVSLESKFPNPDRHAGVVPAASVFAVSRLALPLPLLVFITYRILIPITSKD